LKCVIGFFEDNMRETLTVILTVIILILGFYAYQKTEENYRLKETILKFSKDKDTVYTEGKPDTVTLVKKVSVPKIELKNKELDTLIEIENHSVKIKIDSLVSIEIECKKPELVITRIDTIKVPVLKTMEIEKPCIEKWYDNIFIGIAIGAGIAYLLK